LSKIYISEVCIKLVALRINRYTRSSSQFQKGWWPLHYIHTTLRERRTVPADLGKRFHNELWFVAKTAG